MNLASVVQRLKKERDQAAKVLQSLETALASLTGVSFGKKAGASHISAAGRARIAAAQRARWAKFRGKKVVSMPKKKTMSAAARKKIAQAQKARWAKVRAAKKSA